MSIDARLDKLMPALSARERAILILESWKAGDQEDPLWRRTMPPSQASEFNRLIELMNGSMIQMGTYITIIEQQLQKLELRQAWLVALVLWEEQLMLIRRALRLAVKEPITQAAYETKRAELDSQWVPVTELAEVLAGEHGGWSSEDHEDVEGSDEPVITDTAWERVCAAKGSEIIKAVASGVLKGRGRGPGLKVQEGAFNAWSGRTTVPVPEHVLSYRVLSDSESAEVRSELLALDQLYRALDSSPLVLKDEPQSLNVREVLAGHLRQGLAQEFAGLWQTLKAIELVVEEVAQEFDQADPIRPAKRETLAAMRAKLGGLGEQLIFLDVDVQLPEPDEELLDLLRQMVRRQS